jgi:hypothetical protein
VGTWWARGWAADAADNHDTEGERRDRDEQNVEEVGPERAARDVAELHATTVGR